MRGRPLKFGRPSQVLALTLPDDVVRWLREIHADPAWAIVSLFQRATHHGRSRRSRADANVELAQLSGRRALIIVDPRSYRDLPGLAVIPVAPGRAFLALEAGKGISDLELAVLDRLENPHTDRAERKALMTLRRQVRDWRRSRRLRFSARSIILVELRRQSKADGPVRSSAAAGPPADA